MIGRHLPWGVVRVRGGAPQPALRDGNDVILLAGLGLAGDPDVTRAVHAPDLNPLIELGPAAWNTVQTAAADAPPPARVALADATAVLPIRVPDFVDFYASLEHATNFGRIFRPHSAPLPEHWRQMPIGYHGRASSIVVSGSPIRRPHGQISPGELALTRALDLECELGFVCGPSASGPIAIDAADAHIFGVVLVNDWSARDVQRLENRPLGPFLGKSFATSMSAWITPLRALEHARVAPRAQTPAPAPYLTATAAWQLDIALEVELNGELIARPAARDLYWTPAQMLAHLTVNGARLNAGDLLASGTISGAQPGSEGSLAERFGGERWLADGDEVVVRGRAGEVALGEVRGRIAAG